MSRTVRNSNSYELKLSSYSALTKEVEKGKSSMPPNAGMKKNEAIMEISEASSSMLMRAAAEGPELGRVIGGANPGAMLPARRISGANLAALERMSDRLDRMSDRWSDRDQTSEQTGKQAAGGKGDKPESKKDEKAQDNAKAPAPSASAASSDELTETPTEQTQGQTPDQSQDQTEIQPPPPPPPAPKDKGEKADEKSDSDATDDNTGDNDKTDETGSSTDTGLNYTPAARATTIDPNACDPATANCLAPSD
jgi:hypothetical protein